MESVLRNVLTGRRGGPNRVRILQTLAQRPLNANQLATELALDYKTVRYHLAVMVDNGVVTASGDEYGAVYHPTQRTRKHWETVEAIVDHE